MQVITSVACFCCTLLAATPVMAMLTTMNLDQGVSIHDMAHSLFADWSGVRVTNVEYDGDAVAAGTFSDDTNAVGFASGIVLTSGHTANVIPPNNTVSAGTDNSGGSSQLLSGLIGFRGQARDRSKNMTFVERFVRVLTRKGRSRCSSYPTPS